MCALAPNPYSPRRSPSPGQAQRPVADQAGAEERGGLEVVVGLGDGKAEALVRDDLLGVAAVELIAGEARAVAQVLPPAQAVTTLAVGPAKPGDADALAGGEAGPAFGHSPDDLVPGDERQLRVGQLAVDDVEIGSADAARVHGDQHLTGLRDGHGELGLPERLPGAVEHHRLHGLSA